MTDDPGNVLDTKSQTMSFLFRVNSQKVGILVIRWLHFRWKSRSALLTLCLHHCPTTAKVDKKDRSIDNWVGGVLAIWRHVLLGQPYQLIIDHGVEEVVD